MGKRHLFAMHIKKIVRNLQLEARTTLEKYVFFESSDDFQFNALLKSENDEDFILKKVVYF